MRWRHRKARPECARPLPVMEDPSQYVGCDSLHRMRSGTWAEVRGIRAGGRARCRLASLGLIPGSLLLVVANPGIGPLLLSVGESRLMVERGIAAKLFVQQVRS